MVKNFAESAKVSRPAANKVVKIRTGKKQWEEVPKRWWNAQKNQLWTWWMQQHPTIKLSESKFYKLLRTDSCHIKVCRKATDLCTLCTQYKKDKRRVEHLLNKYH